MRRLGADERALWERVIASVNPLEGKAKIPETPAVGAISQRTATPSPPPPDLLSHPAKLPANTLDGSWDRKLFRGTAEPDLAVDLHGLGLDAAYRLLDATLASAIAGDARILLLITGKAPQDDRPGRGKIRAVVGDWLAASRHSAYIAAVRNAHPRHGGAGALYIVLKRKRLVP